MIQPTFDSLIFDMDGTLWDAVDSYAEIWNEANRRLGLNITTTRGQLLNYMGKTIDVIFSELMGPVGIDKTEYLLLLDHLETTMMPVLGGRFYPGAIEGIRQLSEHYPLFMVSNCGSDGLHNMMRFGGITDCFRDSLTYGETMLDKARNIKLLTDRYGLKAPLYIGDTQGDSDSAHAAGAAMCHVTWGFGGCRDAEMTFDDFPSMTRELIKLKNNPT